MNDHRYIDGVYNYCDRWCERCPLTARCRLFTAEQRLDELEESGRSIDNATFWAAFDVIVPPEFDGDEENEEDDEPVSLEPDDDEESWRDEEPPPRIERKRHPLAEAAHRYGLASHRWLRANDGPVRGQLASHPGHVSPAEAFDVLRWYCLLIGAKLSRATMEPMKLDDEEPWTLDVGWEDEPDEIDETLDEADRSDRAGSAKVALIGIERSLGAWTVLRDALPEHDAAIVAFQRQLARLRRTIDQTMPDARTFVRPGFDDGSLTQET